jgi:hypothetical protein
VLEEKRLLVNRSGVIEYVESGTNLDDVGGLDGLKKMAHGTAQAV